MINPQLNTTIKTRVTYLEMIARPNLIISDPPETIVLLAKPVTVRFYRYLYHAVGRDVGWADREAMNDEALASIIRDDAVYIYVLHVHGSPAGFSEFDLRGMPDIEIKFFGLMPEFRNQGLGGYFLKWTIRQAWTFSPRRLWLHTNDRDHPVALGNYMKNGFSVYDEKIEDQLVIE